MLISRRALVALAAVALAASPALAQDAQPYLSAQRLDLTVMLPPPPSAGSMLEQAELAAAIAIQKNATPERIKLAVEDAEETIFSMFARTLGAKFAAANLPKGSVFFDRVLTSENGVTDGPKKFFARTRPYLMTTELKALVPASKSGSYPSGHTTRVTMAAIVMAAMLPEKRDEIWARANEYAQSRIIGGMHYPSDLEAGRRAGAAMAAVMFTDAAFKADFAVAKTELRAALGMSM